MLLVSRYMYANLRASLMEEGTPEATVGGLC